jgi:hypothetical protein
MKILGISNVCLVGALILGVWVAWSATGPQRVSGNQLVAGCSLSPCEQWAVTCESKPYQTCDKSPDYCRYNKDKGGDCFNAGGGSYQCVGSSKCVSRRDKICVLPE